MSVSCNDAVAMVDFDRSPVAAQRPDKPDAALAPRRYRRRRTGENIDALMKGAGAATSRTKRGRETTRDRRPRKHAPTDPDGRRESHNTAKSVGCRRIRDGNAVAQGEDRPAVLIARRNARAS